MKILQICVNAGSGSVGKIVEDLYYGIKENGNQCVIAYGRSKNTAIPDKDLIKIGNGTQVYLHALHTRIFDRTGMGICSRNATIHFVKEIEKYNPDIIHMHGNYGYYINIEVLFHYLSWKNITVINTLHSCWDFTGHCCYFTYSNCDKWKTGCYKCIEKKSYPASYLFDNSKQNYFLKKKLFTSLKKEIVVTPSEWLASLVKESFLCCYPLEVIRNGIDTGIFSFTKKDLSKYGIKEGCKLILAVASFWQPRKGLADVIELAEKAGKEYQIIVVGISKKLKKKLSANNIIGIEKTEDKSELAALYSAAAVLFNPTYEDNYPTVNLEAIACGTYVVTYNTGGSPEIVKQYHAGEVIRKRDYAALLKIVDKRHQMKVNLNNEKRYDLSKERMVAEYLRLYRDTEKW